MNQEDFTDETLMAFADGELDPSTRRRVEAAAAGDDGLRMRIDAFAHSRGAVHDAVAARVPADVPVELQAAVRAIASRPASREPETGTILPFPADRNNVRAAAWWPSAIAASLALVVGATAGYVTGGRQGTDPLATGSIARTVADALGREPTGSIAEIAGGRVAIIGSFRAGDGSLCREFRVEEGSLGAYASIACHGEAGWRPEVVVRAEPDGGYATASGQAALDAHAHTLGAGPFLDEAAERAMLADLP